MGFVSDVVLATWVSTVCVHSARTDTCPMQTWCHVSPAPLAGPVGKAAAFLAAPANIRTKTALPAARAPQEGTALKAFLVSFARSGSSPILPARIVKHVDMGSLATTASGVLSVTLGMSQARLKSAASSVLGNTAPMGGSAFPAGVERNRPPFSQQVAAGIARLSARTCTDQMASAVPNAVQAHRPS